MRAVEQFQGQTSEFWAHVRLLSQLLGYSGEGGQVKAHRIAEMVGGLEKLGLDYAQVAESDGGTTVLGIELEAYFRFRAQVLNDTVRGCLMTAEEARAEFDRLLGPNAGATTPLNKQSGSKRVPAYLTGMANSLISRATAGWPCDYDPRVLTSFTRENRPLQTLARRVDGAFPCAVNPVAIWEIKEHYHTTTFGSRVAAAVYETLLDGLELRELRQRHGVRVEHCLMLDGHLTWWTMGKSYLCRIIDMLHMGLLDEAIFGREILTRLPVLAAGWVQKLQTSGAAK